MSKRPTLAELRIAETAINMAESMIFNYLANCTYCESGIEAYRKASDAIDSGFKDARGKIHKTRNEITEQSGGS